MSGCCPPPKEEVHNCDSHSSSGIDYFFWTVLSMGVIFYFGHFLEKQLELAFTSQVHHLFHAFFELFNIMFWGLVIGIVFVGILSRVPREYVAAIFGKPGTKTSILRATLAGVLLDLCSHGILMVGMKLYERGASLGQTMAFLIASPWNSLSLTVILVSLIGLKWTVVFILLSVVIAVVSGLAFDFFVGKGVLPKNPHTIELEDDFKLWETLKTDLKGYQFSFADAFDLLKTGISDSRMILKWLLFGALLSSFIKVFVSQEIFQEYFGPTLLGLGATLIATTIIEVCSEGATPLAADILTRGNAPGNSFTFLMAGVSTDYTEVLALKETTSSWKIALFLPLITVPQVLLIGVLLNSF